MFRDRERCDLHLPEFTMLEWYRAEAGYDAVMARFWDSQGMRQAEWARTAVNRVKTPASLHGREKLVEALHRLGFALR